MEQAIKKAIEGGYEYRQSYETHCLLDPRFWQCLGKAEGWQEINYGFTLQNSHGNRYNHNAGAGEWHFKMLEFIDHLASGKNIESFFTNLIGDNA